MKNKQKKSNYRAIDLYSGMGGWALGFKMADIKIVSSYEWWNPAASTQKLNLGGQVNLENIRKLPLKNLPKNVNLVVGSPPCTQFSFSNKGGKGDISDGIKDIYKFLEIVEFISPKYWVMENVPRVANIIEKLISPGGELERFREIIDDIHVVDCSDYGLPQRRKRMLAGTFPYKNLKNFSTNSVSKNLKDVINSLKGNKIIDPNYDYSIDKKKLHDHEFEDYLDQEELRINKEAKSFHRVYNIMPFPEPMNKTSRTITAAETRVSRESLIIDDGKGFRRLSNRERSVLQGFPITYQFNAKSYSERQKMIGNAIPPLLTYYIGCAINKWDNSKAKKNKEMYVHKLPETIPPPATRRSKTTKFRVNRRFRSAIPNLRFGSGVRFELANEFYDDNVIWEMIFYYGNSKNYKSLILSKKEYLSMIEIFDLRDIKKLKKIEKSISLEFSNLRAVDVQKKWNHTINSGLSPFEIVDFIGAKVPDIIKILNSYDVGLIEKIIQNILIKNYKSDQTHAKFSFKKNMNIDKNVFAGLLISFWFNSLKL